MEDSPKRRRRSNAGDDGKDSSSSSSSAAAAALDEKVEKFFELIRGFRDARDRHQKELFEAAAKEEERRRKAGGRAKTAARETPHAWTPSFRCEDFTRVVEFSDATTARAADHLPTISAVSSDVKMGSDTSSAEGDHDGLDLKLTL